MSPALLASLAVALIGLGICAAIAGLWPAPEPVAAPARSRAPRRRLSRATTIKLVAGALVGLLAAVVTGWVILIVLVPLAVLGLPYLLGDDGSRDDIKRLDALDEWTRALANVLGAGISLEQAIATTLKAAPDALRQPLGTLVARLKSRMGTEEALRLFADELGDTTADKIVCTLILGSRRRSVGLAPILEDLAESVAEDVAARRMVQAERAKQTSVMRYVTLITVLVFTGFLLAGGQYVAPYGTPLGQPILAVLIAAYIGVLVWMRRMSQADPLPRILQEL